MLNLENFDMIVKLEEEARATEAEIFLGDYDADKSRKEIESALKNPAFSSAHCMMCVDDNGRALGCVDFATVASYSFGGNLQAYVDWVYVLKEFRHQGIAQMLFSHMADYLKGMGVNEYFLLTAENSDAQKFYHGLEGAEISNREVLRKNISS